MAHPSVGSPPSPAPETAPSPLLKQAVASLMVNLDDELLRYRQSRNGQGGTAPKRRSPLFKTKARSAPSLIHLKPASPPRSTAANAGVSVPPPPPRPYRSAMAGATAGSSALPPALNLGTNPTTYPPVAGSTLAPYQSMPEDYLESSEALLGAVPPPQFAPDFEEEAYFEAEHRPSLIEQLSTPLGLGAMLLLLVGSAGLGYLVTSPTAVEHLRNHAWMQRFQPEPEPPAASAPSESSVSTGLQGIGPDLSEQEFSSLDLDRISTLPSGRTPASASQTLPPVAGSGAEQGSLATGDRAPAIPSAMRAEPVTPVPTVRSTTSPTADSLPRPTVAPPRPTRSTPTTASPAAVAPSDPASPSAAPVPTAIAPPAANAQPPQPLGSVAVAPTPTGITPPPPLAPSAQPAAPAAQPNYYVITDYSGSQSLESARSAVGDAYVRNIAGGTKIQMGAFSQESSARNLAEQLQQQGIPAQVYTP